MIRMKKSGLEFVGVGGGAEKRTLILQTNFSQTTLRRL